MGSKLQTRAYATKLLFRVLSPTSSRARQTNAVRSPHSSRCSNPHMFSHGRIAVDHIVCSRHGDDFRERGVQETPVRLDAYAAVPTWFTIFVTWALLDRCDLLWNGMFRSSHRLNQIMPLRPAHDRNRKSNGSCVRLKAVPHVVVAASHATLLSHRLQVTSSRGPER